MISQTQQVPQFGATAAGAIVLGGNFVGLGVARSLGSHGIPVWVIDADRSMSIARFSKYVSQFTVASNEQLLDLLLQLAPTHHLNGWLLIPGNDEYVELVSTHHEKLSAIYQLVTPPLQVTKFALDKRLTYSRAQEVGIAVPWTLAGERPDGSQAAQLPYPLILKPAVNHHYFPHTFVKALPVENPSDLKRQYAQMSAVIPPAEILIQERIPGGGANQFSYCGVWNNGRPVASLVARRRRQFPIDFGNNSTFVETADQPAVEAAARRFLEGLGFEGLVEIEFKFDARDGEYKILDVNPRPWGWHTLGKAAGLDFPYLLWCQKMGIEPAVADRRREMAWCREITDLVAIAKSREPVTEFKTVIAAIRQGRLICATFDLFDPIPFFAELALWVSSRLRRRTKLKTSVAVNGATTHMPDGKAMVGARSSTN